MFTGSCQQMCGVLSLLLSSIAELLSGLAMLLSFALLMKPQAIRTKHTFNDRSHPAVTHSPSLSPLIYSVSEASALHP